jgi:hypothetical protein
MTDQPGENRIRITSEDLASAAIDERVAEMERARQVALVRDVGAPTSKNSGTLTAIITLTIGGAIGGFAAFLFNRFLDAIEFASDNAFVSNVFFTFSMAFFIGIGVSLAQVIGNKTWNKIGIVAAIAVPTALGAGLILGVAAHFVYTIGGDWVYENALEKFYSGEFASEQQALDYTILWNHPVRGFAWLLVGVAAGIAAGAASKSWKRVGLAAAGGAVGGFIGGAIFDFIATDSEGTEAIAQGVGITLVGTLIGLAASLAEQAAKSRWIEIVRGGLAGKQFILYKSTVSLGSSPQADITLIKDPNIASIAVQMVVRGNDCYITTTALPEMPGQLSQPSLVTVNGQPLTQATLLKDSDLIALGVTELRFRDRVQQNKVPGALR